MMSLKNLLILLLLPACTGWIAPNLTVFSSVRNKAGVPQRKTVQLQNERLRRDMEERSWERARGEGTGEMVSGAILGGLVLGPFGALFGAQIGANVGRKNAIDKARKDEMARLGVSQEMLDAAQDCGVALQQSIEGLEATRESLQTQQSLARRLDQDASDLYEKAKKAMASGDEEAAKKILFQRNTTQEKLKAVLLRCADEKKRLEVMEDNVRVIEARALEIEALLQRTLGAKARQDSFADLSLSDEDPLLQKFRDLGIN